MAGETILLIEDNEDIMSINRRALGKLGYNIIEAKTLQEAAIQLEEGPDIVILDIMLPDGSGLEFCYNMRQRYDIPVLFLTALMGSDNAVNGFMAGGDDYLSKPYDLKELGFRVEALLRRSGRKIRKKTVVGQLVFDHISQRAYIDDKDLLLKPKEYSLLLTLAQHAGRFTPSKELYAEVWGLGGDDTRTVKAHIYRLRQKLAKYDDAFLIDFERNCGYRLIKKTDIIGCKISRSD